MRKSNFDQSSTGLNLVLSCSFDCDRARMDFEECLVNLERNHRKADVWVFTGFGSIEAKDFKRTYKLGTPQELLKAYVSYQNSKDFSLCSLSEVKTVLGNIWQFDATPIRKTTTDELLDAIANDMRWDAPLHEFLEEYFEPEFFELTTTGYSQGDYATVIIPREVLVAYGHEDPTQEIADSFQETIDHLFWDAPLYCKLEINDEVDFHFTDYLKNTYDYDKGQMLEIAEKHLLNQWPEDAQKIIREFLENTLPESPEYI